MPAAEEDAVVVINVDKEAEGNDVGIHPGKNEAGVPIPQVNSHHHEVSLQLLATSVISPKWAMDVSPLQDIIFMVWTRDVEQKE